MTRHVDRTGIYLVDGNEVRYQQRKKMIIRPMCHHCRRLAKSVSFPADADDIRTGSFNHTEFYLNSHTRFVCDKCAIMERFESRRCSKLLLVIFDSDCILVQAKDLCVRTEDIHIKYKDIDGKIKKLSDMEEQSWGLSTGKYLENNLWRKKHGK